MRNVKGYSIVVVVSFDRSLIAASLQKMYDEKKARCYVMCSRLNVLYIAEEN